MHCTQLRSFAVPWTRDHSSPSALWLLCALRMHRVPASAQGLAQPLYFRLRLVRPQPGRTAELVSPLRKEQLRLNLAAVYGSAASQENLPESSYWVARIMLTAAVSMPDIKTLATPPVLRHARYHTA